MSKTTNHPPQPSVIVFGLTSIGKPKAGAFKPTEAEAARNAAAKLGLQVFEITDESTRAFAAKVPAGRIHGHGDAIVPFVPKLCIRRSRAWLDPLLRTQLNLTLRASPLARLYPPIGTTSKLVIACSRKIATPRMVGGRQRLSIGMARFSNCGGRAVNVDGLFRSIASPLA